MAILDVADIFVKILHLLTFTTTQPIHNMLERSLVKVFC